MRRILAMLAVGLLLGSGSALAQKGQPRDSASSGQAKQRNTKGREKRMTVQGTLQRVVGIGGESTGWAIKLDPSVEIDGRTVTLLEIDHKPERWRQLENKHIEATGRLTSRKGVERQFWPVLEVETLKEAKHDNPG